MKTSSQNPEPLTPQTAFRYVLAWARESTMPAEQFKMLPGGDFQARLRGTDFEYRSKSHTLIVWGTVTPFARYAINDPLILSGLERLAAEDPGSIEGARFELVRLPWEIPQNEEPGIFLRREFTTNALNERDFVKAVDRLSTAAYNWGHGRLQQVIRESAWSRGLK